MIRNLLDFFIKVVHFNPKSVVQFGIAHFIADPFVLLLEHNNLLYKED
ncbi:hypothetical protein BH23BAC1_BH23BAC1_36550 [soil metagenome]